MIMYKVPFISISPVYSHYDLDKVSPDMIMENRCIVGTQYLDATFYIENSDSPVADFLDAVDYAITAKQSVILYRQDVRAFADKIGDKQVFRDIKAGLRDRYTVLKLKYNPRTQEFCGEKTAFIIHKR